MENPNATNTNNKENYILYVLVYGISFIILFIYNMIGLTKTKDIIAIEVWPESAISYDNPYMIEATWVEPINKKVYYGEKWYLPEEYQENEKYARTIFFITQGGLFFTFNATLYYIYKVYKQEKEQKEIKSNQNTKNPINVIISEKVNNVPNLNSKNVKDRNYALCIYLMLFAITTTYLLFGKIYTINKEEIDITNYSYTQPTLLEEPRYEKTFWVDPISKNALYKDIISIIEVKNDYTNPPSISALTIFYNLNYVFLISIAQIIKCLINLIKKKNKLTSILKSILDIYSLLNLRTIIMLWFEPFSLNFSIYILSGIIIISMYFFLMHIKLKEKNNENINLTKERLLEKEPKNKKEIKKEKKIKSIINIALFSILLIYFLIGKSSTIGEQPINNYDFLCEDVSTYYCFEHKEELDFDVKNIWIEPITQLKLYDNTIVLDENYNTASTSIYMYSWYYMIQKMLAILGILIVLQFIENKKNKIYSIVKILLKLVLILLLINIIFPIIMWII